MRRGQWLLVAFVVLLFSMSAWGAFTEATVSGKVIVTDTVTGLIWTKEYSGTVTWQNALAYCENLDYGGYTDWRLPNIEELKTLINRGKYNPASDFPGMPSAYFWSSSSRAIPPPRMACLLRLRQCQPQR